VHGVVFDVFAGDMQPGRPMGSGTSCGTFSAPPRYLAMTEDLSFRRKPLTPEQRQARDATRRVEAEKAMRDHEAAQKAFYENRERLRAERLAREAAAAKV
jgi:hypothetical protein